MKEDDVYDSYVKRIYNRLNYQNKNWLAIICGETGSGKSYSALTLASEIGKVHLVFTSLEFLSLINSSKINKGDVIIFDEAGVGLSSREWYSIQNKLLGTILQTFRNMNVAVIFTCPNLSFVDVQARKLFHSYLETSYLDYEEEEAHLRVFDIQVNSRYDKVYFKHPRFTSSNGRVCTMAELILNKPSEEMIEYYEERKNKYTKNLNKEALTSLLNPKGKEEKKQKPDEDKIAKEVLKNKERYLKEYNNRSFIDSDLLMKDYSISERVAKRIKKTIEIDTHI